MSGNFYPPEGHDFVGTDEVRKLSEQNQAMLEASFLGRVVDFRVKAREILVNSAAMKGDKGWAIFHITEDSGDGNVVELNFHKEVLIISRIVATQVHGEPVFTPYFRLITNEMVRVGHEHQWITEDIAVDHENDSQYLLGAMNPLDVSDCSTVAPPLFFVKDGVLIFTQNFNTLFTPSPGVYWDGPDSEAVFPYGTHHCLEDKFFALEKAEDVIKSIAGLEPVYSLTNAESE